MANVVKRDREKRRRMRQHNHMQAQRLLKRILQPQKVKFEHDQYNRRNPDQQWLEWNGFRGDGFTADLHPADPDLGISRSLTL